MVGEGCGEAAVEERVREMEFEDWCGRGKWRKKAEGK